MRDKPTLLLLFTIFSQSRAAVAALEAAALRKWRRALKAAAAAAPVSSTGVRWAAQGGNRQG